MKKAMFSVALALAAFSGVSMAQVSAPAASDHAMASQVAVNANSQASVNASNGQPTQQERDAIVAGEDAVITANAGGYANARTNAGASIH